MKELCEKYPALVMAYGYICMLTNIIRKVEADTNLIDGNDKNCLYRIFKANISCIGLEPEEYDTCIKWFCEVMEY